MRWMLVFGAVCIGMTGGPAVAQIAVSANDNKVKLVEGVTTVVANPPADTVTVFDLGARPPRKVAEIDAPASVVGPPVSVAVSPDEKLALVTANMKVDPADPTKQAPNNRMSVIDLTANPPKVVQTVETGLGPAGVSFTPSGALALVANRNAGTVSVFAVKDGKLEPRATVAIGPANAGVSHVAVAPDGKMALVTRDGDNMITQLTIEGDKVDLAKRDISAGIRPYGLAINPNGRMAAVANIGRGGGDADTISVIDLTKAPYRVVETVTVGQTPEGIMISPDGNLCAVVVHNGSNKAASSPFYNDRGYVRLFRIEGTRLIHADDAPIGKWSQGAAFSADGKTLLVQNMVERNITVFDIEGGKLRDTGNPLPLNGGGAAIRIADKPLK